nr:hypothetical protein [uncultured Rhodoferax sp.]
MRLPALKAPFRPTLLRRIAWLSWSKWLALPLFSLLQYAASPWRSMFFLALVLNGVLCVFLFLALRAWELSLRRQFVREAPLPRFLGAKLIAQYPQLSVRDTELVLHGLRQFFIAYLRSKRQFVAMPSKVVDAAWHEFILHTRGYEQWCHAAFGSLLHHSPAEVLGRDPKRNSGLRRAWFWACKEESIDPGAPTRLPLLFALDKKFAIAGGFTYVPNCRDINNKAGSDAYCGTSFGDGGGGGCGGGGDGSSDGSFSFSSDSGGSDGGSSCGGGCGGD